MNLLIGIVAIWMAPGGFITGLKVVMNSGTVDGTNWKAAIVGILCWPCYISEKFNLWFDNQEKRYIPTRADQHVRCSTKSDFGPGYYERVKHDYDPRNYEPVKKARDPFAFLDDLNDPLDNTGCYDERHFAKAVLERKKI